MGIRITQQYMYGSMVDGMQSTLSRYMESMEQGSTQKKVNRPSDDPAAYYRILTTRDSIDETKKYLTNINEATGWLKLTDSTMNSLTTLMQSIKALMNQASTDCTAAERQIMADEAWQMFGQILNLSNTEFNGNKIFAGHKYNESAFDKGLAVSVSMMDDSKPGDEDYENSPKKAWSDVISDGLINVSGTSDSSIAVQFLEKGTLDATGFHVASGNDEDGNPYDADGDGALAFRWSSDGGKTWQTGSLPDGASKISVGSGVEIDFTKFVGTATTANVTTTPATGPAVTAEGLASDVQVKFVGTVPGGGDIDLTTTGTQFTYQYSIDGGASWVTETASTTGNQPLRLPVAGGYIEVGKQGAANNTIAANFEVTAQPGNVLSISAAENTGDDEFSTEDGTVLFVKPTGIYQGDTNNPPPQITISNTKPGVDLGNLKVETEGTFGSNVLIRFDGVKQADGTFSGNIPLTGNAEFAYSYSTDNGTTWVTAYAQATGNGNPGSGQPLRLPVPGGFIDIDARNAHNRNTIETGTQVLIHPRRADLGYEVMKDTYIDVNRVGTEVFGGYYDDKPVLSDDTNLFNIMGDFIAALEFNSQEGCQEAYSKLSSCLEYVTTQTSRTGALENRVSLAYDVNNSTLLSQEEVLSGTEDIDLTELLSKLTQQQTTYQTVLMASSKIMNIGLMNYL